MLIRPTCLLALASLGLAAAPGHGRAADFGRPEPRGFVAREEVLSAIVVPDCVERPGALLLACAPREELAGPDAIELQRILSSVRRPRRTPYPQLLDRP